MTRHIAHVSGHALFQSHGFVVALSCFGETGQMLEHRFDASVWRRQRDFNVWFKRRRRGHTRTMRGRSRMSYLADNRWRCCWLDGFSQHAPQFFFPTSRDRLSWCMTMFVGGIPRYAGSRQFCLVQRALCIRISGRLRTWG